MPLPCDLYLLINNYLRPNTRRALAKVNPNFSGIYRMWCAGKAQLLHQKCRFLRYLSVTQLTTMLCSDVTITYELTFSCEEAVNRFFLSHEDIIDDEDEDRPKVEAFLLDMMHTRGLRRIPTCHPLFIFDYGYQLIVLDDKLNLYIDDEFALSNIDDINFHNNCVETSVLTQTGEVYDFESREGPRQLYEEKFINHISGMYYIHDSYYLSNDDEDLDIKISDDPIVLFCWGSKSTCLITCACANSTTRTSFIVGFYDNEILFRIPIPTVRIAVDLESGYLVLFDDGSCAVLRRDIYVDQTQIDTTIQNETYDHIVRIEDKIIARQGEQMYSLKIEYNDQVSSEKIDNIFPAESQHGVYRLSY